MYLRGECPYICTEYTEDEKDINYSTSVGCLFLLSAPPLPRHGLAVLHSSGRGGVGGGRAVCLLDEVGHRGDRHARLIVGPDRYCRPVMQRISDPRLSSRTASYDLASKIYQALP